MNANLTIPESTFQVARLDAAGDLDTTLFNLAVKMPHGFNSFQMVNGVVPDGHGNCLCLLNGGVSLFDGAGRETATIVDRLSEYSGPTSACLDAQGRLLLAYFDRKAVYAFAPTY